MIVKLTEKIIDKFRVRFREDILNPIFGRFRCKFLINNKFTIISNNCWGGHVYRYFNLAYDSPTIGLYMFSEDYIKFIYNLKEYLNADLRFISYKESRYRDILESRGGRDIECPIGLLNDIEIVFLHYHSQDEAYEKWTRRKNRIHWDHIIYKMSEQNLCNEYHLRMFDMLKGNKMVFVTKDYGLNSQVIFGDYRGENEILNDTLHFRKYVHLVKLINGKPFKKRQPQNNIYEQKKNKR